MFYKVSTFGGKVAAVDVIIVLKKIKFYDIMFSVLFNFLHKRVFPQSVSARRIPSLLQGLPLRVCASE